MEFFKEKRLVWMTGGAEAAPAEGGSSNPEAEEPKTEEADTEIEEGKKKLQEKVDSAQVILEQLNAIYGLNEQGIDKNTTNDPAVTGLNKALGDILSDFEAGISEIDRPWLEELNALDTDLMGKVTELVGNEGISVDGAETADIVAKGMTKAAGVEVKDAAGVAEIRAKFLAEIDADEKLMIQRSDKAAEARRFILGYNEAYPGAVATEIETMLDTAAKDHRKLLTDLPADKQEAASATFISEFEKKFYAKALEGAKTADPSITEDGMKDKAKAAFEDAMKKEPLEDRMSVYEEALQVDGMIEQAQTAITAHAAEILAALQGNDVSAYNLTVPATVDGKSISMHLGFSWVKTATTTTLCIDAFSVTDSDGTTNPDFITTPIVFVFDKPSAQLSVHDVQSTMTDELEGNRSRYLGLMQSNLLLADEDVAKAQDGIEQAEKEGPPIPVYQRRIAESVLAYPDTKTAFNAGRVIGDKAPNYAMSDSSGYNINTHVEQPEGTNEALLVMDYTGATFRQAFDSAAAFKKYYPTLDLPEKGNGPFKITEDVYLSERRPRPFKGERRRRDLNVTVERDDQGNITKVNVTVSNIQFGTPPNSVVHIRLGKPASELKDVRDILYPSDEYKTNRFSDSQEQSAEVGAEAISEEDLTKYREAIAKLAKIDLNDPKLADMPEFLRGRIKPHLEKIRGLVGLDDEALRAELMNIQIGYDSIFQMITGDVPASITGFPPYKEYETFFDPEKGLKYGEGGYGANEFDDHFGAAGTRLRNHFFETDAMGGGRHEFVGIQSANFVFRGNGDGKSVSGVFVLKLKSDPSVTTRFEFTNIDGSTWDQIMLKAVDQMTRDKQVNKDLGHTTFRKNLRERDRDVKDAERIRDRREKVAERESENMATRAEYVENRPVDSPAFDPFTVPDYQARSEEALLSKIAMDYGEFNEATHQPVDYVIEERDGRWYAVNKNEPSLQPYNAAGGYQEPAQEATSEQQDAIDVSGVVTPNYLKENYDVSTLSKENYGRYFAKLTQLYVENLQKEYPGLHIQEDIDFTADISKPDKTRITAEYGGKYAIIDISRAYVGKRVSDMNMAGGAQIGVRFGREVGKPDGDGYTKVTYDVGHPYVDLNTAFSAVAGEFGAAATPTEEEAEEAAPAVDSAPEVTPPAVDPAPETPATSEPSQAQAVVEPAAQPDEVVAGGTPAESTSDGATLTPVDATVQPAEPAPDVAINWSSERPSVPDPVDVQVAAPEDGVTDVPKPVVDQPSDTPAQPGAEVPDGAQPTRVNPYDLTAEQRVAAQEALLARQATTSVGDDPDDLYDDFDDFEFDEASVSSGSTLSDQAPVIEPPEATLPVPPAPAIGTIDAPTAVGDAPVPTVEPATAAAATEPLPVEEVVQMPEIATAEAGAPIEDAPNATEVNLAMNPETVDTPKELRTFEKGIRAESDLASRDAMMDDRMQILKAHPELAAGTTIPANDEFNYLVRRLEGMSDDDPQREFFTARKSELLSSDEKLDTANAEHTRLSEEMHKLAGRNVWDGVEEKFNILLTLGIQPTYQDYLNGAQSARALGNVSDVIDRLEAAKALNPTSEVTDWLSNIEGSYGHVTMTLPRALRSNPDVFKPAIPPFAPDQRTAIEAAKTSLAETGSFSGYLPAGLYILNGANILVEAGKDLDVNAPGVS